MDSNELKILAKKYLDGDATPEEKEMLDQWYSTIHSDLPETVELAKPENEHIIKQRMFDNLNKNLFTGTSTVTIEKPAGASVKRLTIWLGSVAAAVAFMVFAWLWYTNPAAISSKRLTAERQLVKVPTNRVIHINLPDGSKVSLNAGSVFRYPKSFAGKTRTVELVEGQAFFDIRHQTEHPFIVKTKNLDITVLGTSFDVRSYKKDGNTRVSVVTGKVGITMPDKADGTTIMLLPHQQVTLSAVTSQLVKEPVPAAEVTDWVKNNFVFDNESLRSVFKALEDEYHAKIIVADPKLLDEKIHINISNQPLDSIIQTISYIHHFKYQMANDSTVVIK